jgi:bifunctional UDP-N-acetylglucosamine pyrophosphorylase/glucosamine-1-phosphate N-acetyltransferase
MTEFSMGLSIVILAAGQGTRMRSQRPKVLHEVAGRPMLGHVIAVARSLDPDAIHVIHGHGAEQVRAAFPDTDLDWVLQAEQLGTGHAVAQALPRIPASHRVLVLCADVPLLRRETLSQLLEATGDGAGLLAVTLEDPTGYGRVLRDADGDVRGIVEEKDASDAERRITEVNTGVMCLPAGRLAQWLDGLDRDNAQGELYLTDVIAMARRDGVRVALAFTDDALEVQGVNNRAQLAAVERAWQAREARRLMLAGATVADPARLDVRGELHCGRDVFIDINCLFQGRVELADDVEIGPNCVVRDSRIGPGTRLEAGSVVDGADIGDGCSIGPLARVRPGTRLAAGARVGNFVETKNTRVGAGSKVNHLSYIGDAEIGAGVNIGAGTITCNYDGASKHRTVIGDDVFIGSGTQLVAPVTVGHGATIGAGTTLRDDAPADALTLTNGERRTIDGWRRPKKNEQ